MFVVIGGGAAGIFAAITCARFNPKVKVVVLEKTRQLLSKVRISGGGRCNVTHCAFDPKLLARNYPRGSKELLGPFSRFQPQDTIAWFESKGVRLKTEEDGRMFPTTDSSETIIQCLLKEAEAVKVEIRTEQRITDIKKTETGFEIQFENQEPLACQAVLLATGSSPQGLQFAKEFGHSLVPPVPSLFTFNVPSSPLLDLSGIAVSDVRLSIKGSKLEQRGPMLLTHWGFSGPAALKLSAFGARILHETGYQADLLISWIPDRSAQALFETLIQLKDKKPMKGLENENISPLPSNLWKRLLLIDEIYPDTPLSQVPNKALRQFAEHLAQSSYRIEGKTTYKQEFVTCGGISLKEVDFKTMESKIVPRLYFSGEILNIDGITGGFNFQNAWTTAWIAGQAMAAS